MTGTFTVETFADLPALIAEGERMTEGHDAGRVSFRGTETWEQAVKLYRDGWLPGADSIAAALDTVQLPEVTERRIAWRQDVTGGRANIGAILAGDPRGCWRPIMSTSRPIVRIATTGCPSCNVPTESILAYGAAVVALCDRFNGAGFGTEVVMVEANSVGKLSTGRRFVIACTLRRSEQPFDLSSFAFAVAHPSMFRRFLFAAGQARRLSPPDGYGRLYPDYPLAAEWCAANDVDIDLSGSIPDGAAAIQARVASALDEYRARHA